MSAIVQDAVWTSFGIAFFAIGMKTEFASPVAIAELFKFAGMLNVVL